MWDLSTWNPQKTTGFIKTRRKALNFYNQPQSLASDLVSIHPPHTNDDKWKTWFNWPSCLIHLFEISSYPPSNICRSKMDQSRRNQREKSHKNAQTSARWLRDFSNMPFNPGFWAATLRMIQKMPQCFTLFLPCLSCLLASPKTRPEKDNTSISTSHGTLWWTTGFWFHGL